ncbi:uncharacterized protein [Anolis sagrei]|uniref:uncharacterized protein n=1 Tax=Anolis sagrei TaxID=38937 RepID=UPI003521A99C
MPALRLINGGPRVGPTRFNVRGNFYLYLCISIRVFFCGFPPLIPLCRDSRTTLPANCTVETNTLGSWNSWVQKDFTPTVAQRHWEAKFHNSPYFSSSTTTSTSSLGSRTTSPAHCMVETNIPGSWISWVVKDFTPTVAQRHWEAADSPYFNSSSSSSSLLDQRSSRLTLTPAESPTPDPCAREMVVQALQEKERPEKRKAEGTDLELNHYGREKRSRYESAESGSSQVPASGGAPASIVPHPGTLDTLPGHKRAFKRKHCSSPLSTSSTESISYGIPQIFKAKGGKKTLKSTHGQDNLSKEPSCSQSSHLENGPHRTMQVKMDVVETPRQEASNLQAPALCPDSPKWMSVSFVRINPNKPSKLVSRSCPQRPSLHRGAASSLAGMMAFFGGRKEALTCLFLGRVPN